MGNLENFIDVLCYGSSIGNYDGGVNIEDILPELYKIENKELYPKFIDIINYL